MVLGASARRGLGRPGRLAVDVAGYTLGAALAGLAAARGGKAVHPAGVVHEARLVIDGTPAAPGASELLSTAAEHASVLRFSRSLGVPRPIPDLLGASLRVIDAYGPGRHQDVMMVSSIDLPILHHLFVPATDVQQRPYSSSLPYRAGGDRFLVGLTPDASSPCPPGSSEFERLRHAAETGSLTFGLGIAPLRGRFRRVGTVHVGNRLGADLDALRFNPFNSGGGMEPVGALNRLRDYAYPLSQAAWGRNPQRRRAQRRADAALPPGAATAQHS